MTAAETLSDRYALRIRYRANRARSLQFFSLVRNVMYDRPLKLRLPFLFYYGHLPVFSYMTLARNALGYPPVNEYLETLFRRGIDPGDEHEADERVRAWTPVWPELDEVEKFVARLDTTMDQIFLTERLIDDRTPMLAGGEAVFTVFEHEEMHHETLLYIMQCMTNEDRTIDGKTCLFDYSPAPASTIIDIPAGRATLGSQRNLAVFGWDNEFDEHVVDVPAFRVASLPVTNAEYLAYVEAGGDVPASWKNINGRWLLTTPIGDYPLPPALPVSVSLASARAYARTRGARIMTEPEYHRAAYGTPEGHERPYPWGIEAPRKHHGNFGMRRYASSNVGSCPRGASAFGVHELVGNGWELTSTPFMPFKGFTPSISYPEYSADFFDGHHFVMKGASPHTTVPLIRRSLRNWFFESYPYAHSKFRLTFDA